MSDWKELEIDNLPPDILTGDYEFEFIGICYRWTAYCVNGIYEIIEELETGVAEGIRYRKRQPKAPSHEEIMTKWWKIDDYKWARVSLFTNGKDVFEKSYYICDMWYSCVWFTGRPSADIPPEAE